MPRGCSARSTARGSSTSSARISRSRTTPRRSRAPRSPPPSAASPTGSDWRRRKTASTGARPNQSPLNLSPPRKRERRLAVLLEAGGGRRDAGKRRVPDLHEALAHGERLGLVAQADRAAIEARRRPAHVVLRIEHQERILDLADVLLRAIYLH